LAEKKSWREAAEDGHVVRLIRQMSIADPLWGAPRIVGELAKLGIDVAKSTVEKYRVRRREPPSPTWCSFLKNHLDGIAAIDFFVVPTVTFRVLFVFVVLSVRRRKVIHFNVTANPSAWWTALQMVSAFPDETTPRYVTRDRDGIYGRGRPSPYVLAPSSVSIDGPPLVAFLGVRNGEPRRRGRL
jgi:hypothetical protein